MDLEQGYVVTSKWQWSSGLLLFPVEEQAYGFGLSAEARR